MKWKIVLLALLTALLVAGTVRAGGGGLWMPHYTLNSGGGETAGGAYAMKTTIGQSVVGVVAGGAMSHCTGFWCGGMGATLLDNHVFIPLAMRDS